eukprot:XP_002261670.1 [Plasmodium knowlesi strain H]
MRTILNIFFSPVVLQHELEVENAADGGVKVLDPADVDLGIGGTEGSAQYGKLLVQGEGKSIKGKPTEGAVPVEGEVAMYMEGTPVGMKQGEQEYDEDLGSCFSFMLFNARHCAKSFGDIFREMKQGVKKDHTEEGTEQPTEQRGIQEESGATGHGAQVSTRKNGANVDVPIGTEAKLAITGSVNYDKLFQLIVDGDWTHEHIKQYEDVFRQNNKDTGTRTPLEQESPQEPQVPVGVPKEEIKKNGKEEIYPKEVKEEEEEEEVHPEEEAVEVVGEEEEPVEEKMVQEEVKEEVKEKVEREGIPEELEEYLRLWKLQMQGKNLLRKKHLLKRNFLLN